jgi:hypothetical protein
MKLSNRLLLILGCTTLTYTILAKFLRWPASDFFAGMSGTFFLFALIRWIGSQKESKITTRQ